MSTRALIAIEDLDRKCRSVYLHNDGYYKNGAGEVLLKFYPTKERAEEILKLGSLSCLGYRQSKQDTTPADADPEQAESFQETVAYCRDREEEMEPPYTWDNRADLADKAKRVYDVEYIYLLSKGTWLMYNYNYGDDHWYELEGWVKGGL